MIKKPQNNDKNDLIADIRDLVKPTQYRQPRYDSYATSYTANKVVDKLLVRLGIITIIGLLGYIIIRDSTRDKKCRSD